MKKLVLLGCLLAGTVSVYSQDNDRLINDLKILSSGEFEGRRVGTAGNKKAAEYIIGRFNALELKSYTDSFMHPFVFRARQGNELQGVNLLGYIPGKSDRIIVISAHYDHVGIRDGKTYHGADDNASGVAALLYVADYFRSHTPRHTLLFAAFDAEESGLRGAEAFVKSPPVKRKKIALNINLDMVARSEKNELYASGTYKYPAIKELLKSVDENSGISLRFGHDLPGSGREDWTMQSDQGAFARENIPFVYFGVEDHADYHQPTDTFENVKPAFFLASAALILKSVQTLDQRFKKP